MFENSIKSEKIRLNRKRLIIQFPSIFIFLLEKGGGWLLKSKSDIFGVCGVATLMSVILDKVLNNLQISWKYILAALTRFYPMVCTCHKWAQNGCHICWHQTWNSNVSMFILFGKNVLKRKMMLGGKILWTRMKCGSMRTWSCTKTSKHWVGAKGCTTA